MNKKQKREAAAAKRAEFERTEAERHARLIEQRDKLEAAEKTPEAKAAAKKAADEARAKMKERRERQARRKADRERLAMASGNAARIAAAREARDG